MYFKQPGEAVLPNIFQNDSNSTKEATPPEEPEAELFLEKPEPCQTDPVCDGPFVPGQFGWKVRPSHHSIACSTSSSKSTIHTATLLLVELPPCLLPMH